MKVSVVIPAYNAATTLERAVSSCLSQGEAIAEIIIVENGSLDATASVIERLRLARPELIIALSEPISGSSAARNAGVAAAQCPWVQFVDADDELLPGKVDRQLALVGDETHWVMGAWEWQYPDGSREATELAGDPWKGVVYNGGLGSTNSNLYRRSTLLQVGSFDQSLINGEDVDLYVKLLKAGVGWVQDPVPGAIYHDHDNNRLSRARPVGLAREQATRKADVANWLRAHRPDYYRENEAFFRAAILRGIRQLYTVDRSSGHEYLKKYFPNGVRMEPLDGQLLPSYAFLYGPFGFDRVERMRVWYRNH